MEIRGCGPFLFLWHGRIQCIEIEDHCLHIHRRSLCLERLVNAPTLKLAIQRITALVNSILMFLKTETADLPLTEPCWYLPRGIFPMRPPLPETFQAHAVFPPSLPPLLELLGPSLSCSIRLIELYFVYDPHEEA